MRLLISASLLLTACDDSNPAPVTHETSLMAAGSWTIGPVISGKNYSHNVPLHPTPTIDGWAIDLPQVDGVHYVTRPCSLAGKERISLHYRIDLAEGAKIVPSSAPGQPSMGPTLYFQQAGDDWNTDGKRWWATWLTPTPIVAGEFTITAPLNGLWTSVNVKTAATSPADFASAKANVAVCGFTLGGGTGSGHGAYVQNGSARITVLDFRIE